MRRTAPLVLLVLSFAITLVLALSACDDDEHDVGAYCETDGECMTGRCYTRDGANYCTVQCNTEGSTGECPEFTICKRVHGGPQRCLLMCEHDADCPSDSDCKKVNNSSLRGCEPKD